MGVGSGCLDAILKLFYVRHFLGVLMLGLFIQWVKIFCRVLFKYIYMYFFKWILLKLCRQYRYEHHSQVAQHVQHHYIDELFS